MKQPQVNVVFLSCLVGLLFAFSVLAAPQVSNVVGQQRAGTKLVDITYDLTDAWNATLSVSIKISSDAGATWNVPCTSLSGDGIGDSVIPGTGKAIVWDAGADWNGQWSDQMKVEVTAIAGAEALYTVIDLSAGPDASNYPVSTLNDVPAGGWTDEYKTTKLVLRRIPAGTFVMGSPVGELGRDDSREFQHQVTLTQDFYVGVFEVTQKQWERVKGNWPSYFENPDYRDSRPVEWLSYNVIRGSVKGSGWPANNDVDADSFLGRLRDRTGLTFDLPTEAQWEYACRAGTTTALNSGKNLTTTQQCPNLDAVSRNYFNGGSVNSPDASTAGGTAKVGSYLPNQWGLYDMHGNVSEFCLDWLQLDLGEMAQTDPLGATDGSDRVNRGGGCKSLSSYCRSAFRSGLSPGTLSNSRGFRLSLVVP